MSVPQVPYFRHERLQVLIRNLQLQQLTTPPPSHAGLQLCSNTSGLTYAQGNRLHRSGYCVRT